MAEREQEREEHQKEVERLEELMQGKDKSANSQQRLQTEVGSIFFSCSYVGDVPWQLLSNKLNF